MAYHLDKKSTLPPTTKLSPTLLQSQHFGLCCDNDDLDKALNSSGEVGLIEEWQSDDPLLKRPTKRPGAVKNEAALAVAATASQARAPSTHNLRPAGVVLFRPASLPNSIT